MAKADAFVEALSDRLRSSLAGPDGSSVSKSLATPQLLRDALGDIFAHLPNQSLRDALLADLAARTAQVWEALAGERSTDGGGNGDGDEDEGGEPGGKIVGVLPPWSGGLDSEPTEALDQLVGGLDGDDLARLILNPTCDHATFPAAVKLVASLDDAASAAPGGNASAAATRGGRRKRSAKARKESATSAQARVGVRRGAVERCCMLFAVLGADLGRAFDVAARVLEQQWARESASSRLAITQALCTQAVLCGGVDRVPYGTLRVVVAEYLGAALSVANAADAEDEEWGNTGQQDGGDLSSQVLATIRGLDLEPAVVARALVVGARTVWPLEVPSSAASILARCLHYVLITARPHGRVGLLARAACTRAAFDLLEAADAAGAEGGGVVAVDGARAEAILLAAEPNPGVESFLRKLIEAEAAGGEENNLGSGSGSESEAVLLGSAIDLASPRRLSAQLAGLPFGTLSELVIGWEAHLEQRRAAAEERRESRRKSRQARRNRKGGVGDDGAAGDADFAGAGGDALFFVDTRATEGIAAESVSVGQKRTASQADRGDAAEASADEGDETDDPAGQDSSEPEPKRPRRSRRLGRALGADDVVVEEEEDSDDIAAMDLAGGAGASDDDEGKDVAEAEDDGGQSESESESESQLRRSTRLRKKSAR